MVNSSCYPYFKSLSCSNIEDIARDSGSVDADEESLNSKMITTVLLKLIFQKTYPPVTTHAKLNLFISVIKVSRKN